MTPVKYDLDLYRGDTHAFRVVLWDDKAQTIPFDLTGAAAEAEWRDKLESTLIVNLVATISLPNIIDVSITTDIWTSAPGSGVWDLELSWPGRVLTVVAGSVKVTADVTNSDRPNVASRRLRAS